jgi:hypothetical protein
MFDALEWLAAMCSHVPNKGEQMVRYYGYYSNVSRGKRKNQNQDELIPCILEPDESSTESRKNWARLIQKIYEVGPLTCPKCSGKMKVISVIEDEDITRLPCLSMTSNGYELREMRRAVNLVIMCQEQWRAGKKDPQAPGIMGG